MPLPAEFDPILEKLPAALAERLREPSEFLSHAYADKIATLSTDGKRIKITYQDAHHTEILSDPEEIVRAEFWAELIYRYGYDARRIAFEQPVPARTNKEKVDLILFHDDELTRPFAVIECKRDGISDTEFLQAVEQVFGYGIAQKFRPNYVMIVAGLTRRVYDCSDRFGVLEREKNRVAGLPLKGKKPVEYRYVDGGEIDLRAIPGLALGATLKKCHDTLWGGGRLSATAAFGELCKILFVKIHDERDTEDTGKAYKFQRGSGESDTSLAGRVRQLYDTHKDKDPDVFTENIRISDGALSLVVEHLEEINLHATDLDAKGQAFQAFMDGFFKGSFGQFFTPRPLIQFAVKMLQPTADDLVLDPACGSGGFLLAAMDAVRDTAKIRYKSNPVNQFKHWHDFAEKHLYGIEINDEISRVAKMNMILHDDGHSNVVCEDALIGFDYFPNDGDKDKLDKGNFSLILTNPPFGATVRLAERAYLSDYQLGKVTTGKAERDRPNQKTEILYLERVRDFLKHPTGKASVNIDANASPGMPFLRWNGGRAAIVLPDGILTNASLQYVRDFLLEHFRLLAVVSLPPFAFAAFGAGVKSSLVFVQRRGQTEVPDDDEPIFMASPERVGYDATGRETPNDLPDVAAQFHAFLKDPQPFFV